MNDKPEGWYYVGDGKLRYRDDYGWTEHYLDTSDPRTREWPPPAPKPLLAQPAPAETAKAAISPRKRGFGWRRHKAIGRPR